MPEVLEQGPENAASSAVGETAGRRLRVLRLVVSLGECNAAYNQFSLPVRDRYDTTICAYYPPTSTIAEGITVRAGNGTLKGYLKCVKTVLSGDTFDVIHAHSPQLVCLFFLGNFFNRRLMRKLVFTAHNSYENFKLRNRLLLIPAFLWSARVVCCGAEACKSFPWIFKQLAGRRLRAVANGVDLDRVDGTIARVQRETTSGFNVVTVGRLIPIKDPSTAIQAFAAGTNGESTLTLMGDGKLRDALVTEAADLNGRVEMTGVIPRQEVFERLCGSGAFLSTSHGEGLPMAVLEAMACRCPVILSDIPPHREIAAGTDFVPLVSPGDIDGFARQIKRFETMSVDERRQVGERCRQHIEEHFSLESMHRGYADVYNEVVGI